MLKGHLALRLVAFNAQVSKPRVDKANSKEARAVAMRGSRRCEMPFCVVDDGVTAFC